MILGGFGLWILLRRVFMYEKGGVGGGTDADGGKGEGGFSCRGFVSASQG